MYAIRSYYVLKDDKTYKMWYSHRNLQNYREDKNNSYRIGYAESSNGIDWTRLDDRITSYNVCYTKLLRIGMSAANMAFEAIFHAKFENCILIGQDLAYGSDGETHSDGHLYGTKESRKRATMDVTAYGGEGSVKTTEIWNLFRNFFESDIYYAKQQGMQVINATEGGARIEGSVEMPFAEARNNFV